MSPRLLSLALLLLLSLPAIAQQLKNELAVSVGRSQYDQLDDGTALGISYNRFWTESVSTRIGAFAAGEAEEANAGIGDDDVVGAYYATAEYHFLRGGRVSPFAGVGFALAFASIERLNARSANDTGFAPIVLAGIDIQLTQRFAIGADVSYFQFDADLEDQGSAALDPTTVLVSAKYRY
ncbi:MAG TPA: OmpW family outer membrane protein [Thermoanaerobaculia bacterium]|nr:OmpW family outer membrane protein [Thermoanaerobaculia bacterium]